MVPSISSSNHSKLSTATLHSLHDSIASSQRAEEQIMETWKFHRAERAPHPFNVSDSFSALPPDSLHGWPDFYS